MWQLAEKSFTIGTNVEVCHLPIWRVGESNPRLFIMSEYRYVKLLYNFLSKIVFLLLHATVAPTRNFYTHILFTITDINNFTKLVTPTRLELVTPTLKVWCSTNWAKRSSVFNKKAYMWSLQTILRSHYKYKYKTWTNFCSVLSFFVEVPRIELGSLDFQSSA